MAFNGQPAPVHNPNPNQRRRPAWNQHRSQRPAPQDPTRPPRGVAVPDIVLQSNPRTQAEWGAALARVPTDDNQR